MLDHSEFDYFCSNIGTVRLATRASRSGNFCAELQRHNAALAARCQPMLCDHYHQSQYRLDNTVSAQCSLSSQKPEEKNILDSSIYIYKE